ncbi:DUF2993 domain-containing protein [Nocardia sp. CNY236]|uniref:LmeA family phospholipid-binding protein n=1 Tax=Nocardia sp. CNY236 TaxID=1169152 RepID=UPI000423ECD3|nr:DUF2993 domain-containing protein [Nocardia sp. CNY236]
MSTNALSASRITRRTLLIALSVVVVLLATVLIGGELYARHAVASCISTQFEKEMGSEVDVSFGAKPMLVTWMDGKLSSVRVDADDANFGRAVGMSVHAVLHDVDVADQNGGVIGSSSADVTWSNEGIQQTLGGMVSRVSSSPSSGVLTLTVLGGFGQLELKPQIQDGTVQMETTSAQLFGIGIPSDLVQSILDTFTEKLQSYPLGLAATHVEVTDSGIAVELAGGRTQLEPADGSSGMQC